MFENADAGYLRQRILEGRAVLFLGAGASVGSTNGDGEPIKTGGQLAALLDKKLSHPGDDLDLGELYSAYADKFGEKSALELLLDEYGDCTPGPSLERLFKYAWRRIYTLNIDDAVEKVPRRLRVQRVETVSRASRIEDKRTFERVEVVHLNGFVTRPLDGFIFTAEQYQEELLRNSNWYRQCAEDFLDNTFIFIGTKLEEPVFKAHVQNVTRETGLAAGRSFLIVPEVVSEKKKEQLAKKNIVVVSGDISSFVAELRRLVGETWGPLDVINATSKVPLAEELLGKISSDLKFVSNEAWLRAHTPSDAAKNKLGRDFYNGFPPEWETVAGGVAAPLRHDVLLSESIGTFLKSDRTMFFVVGASGTGKTTALMKCCLDLRKDANNQVFYLEDSSRADVSDIIAAMKGAGAGQKILFIDNISLFQEIIPILERNARQEGIKIVTQVRSGEWNSRVQRFCEFPVAEWKIPDLHQDDYEHLRRGLVQYAIAPEFRSKPKDEQLGELKRARHQLLALMKTITGQRGFEALIESEYQSIESRDARYIYMIVGLAALGKGRFTPGELTGISSYLPTRVSVAAGIADLKDLVTQSSEGRLVGRHDVIIRHVIETTANVVELADCIIALLKYFRTFGEPVISRLDRQKGNVFKYIINWSFYIDIFRSRNETEHAKRIYESIEKDYQQDGLYWLQRGLFHRRIGESGEALEHLERSVQAYPDGQFARHALAQQRLINAANEKAKNPKAVGDVAWAVQELNRQDRDLASWVKDPAAEEYPLVTLSRGHLNYLVQIGQMPEARQFAREYFERLQILSKSIPRSNPYVESATRACLLLSTTGQWDHRALSPKVRQPKRRR